RRPVRLEIELPASEIDNDLTVRMSRTLNRYCNHRTLYNERAQRATRFTGISSLRIGLPIAALGLLLTWTSVRATDEDSAIRLITDHVGWVLGWLALWFPLDALLFYPLTYGRENRVLALLADAEVVVRPTLAR